MRADLSTTDIAPAQCRMARAALKMGVRELATLARVSTNTITRFELDEPLRPRTVDAIILALEAVGVVFIQTDAEGGPGVRLASWYSAQFVEAMKTGLSPPRLIYISDRAIHLESATPHAKVIVDMDRTVFHRRWGNFALDDHLLEGQILINMAAFAGVIARLYLEKKGGFAVPLGTKIINIHLGDEELKDLNLYIRMYGDTGVDPGEPPSEQGQG
jgi:transcriptional regulator with XRE-family HTH domain